jgi:ubiquinone/menaquinone biosynthesis C-methylase UbiE
MAESAVTTFKNLQGFVDALVELNLDSQGTQPLRRSEHDQTIKRKIELAYNGNVTSGLNSDSLQFWNWGMSSDAIRREIIQTLGEFDRRISDGYSEQLYFYALKQVPNGAGAPRRVLEVGCGNGVGLNFLSRAEPKSEFVGVDLAGNAIARANEKHSRPGTLSYVAGDAEHLPFGDAEFDVVINVESSHNYPNLGAFFSEVARVLRPNGFFSHVDMFTDSRRDLVEQCKRAHADELAWLDEHDISPYVKAAIQARMTPDSLFQRQLTELTGFAPWPLNGAAKSAIMESYGRRFAYAEPDPWMRVFRWLGLSRRNMLQHVTSYRYALAGKRA